MHCYSYTHIASSEFQAVYACQIKSLTIRRSSLSKGHWKLIDVIHLSDGKVMPHEWHKLKGKLEINFTTHAIMVSCHKCTAMERCLLVCTLCVANPDGGSSARLHLCVVTKCCLGAANQIDPAGMQIAWF